MPKPPHPSHRRILLLLLAALLLSILTYTLAHPPTPTPSTPPPVPDSILHGLPTSHKLANETLKADLGRAAWKLLHTTMAKYPDAPTQDEQTALFSYIHLFARLYPWSVFPYLS